jgi:alpha-L-rhamnosidase
VLSAQQAPPVREQETVVSVSYRQVASGVWLYDLGRNLAGWPEVTVNGAAGRTVTLRPGEKLTNGRVDQVDVGEPVLFRFTPRTGAAETWHPRFMYYGFRYIEVSGLAAPLPTQDVRARVLRADNRRTGRIETSDATLNSTYDLVVRAVESNMFSVLTDCPHREKLGWLEEVHLLYDTVAANFDVAAYYRKIARDIRDAQLGDGMVPDIAPEYTVFVDGFRDDPNWGGAMIMVPFRHFQVYGDEEPLRDGYPAMRLYMDYLASKADDNVLAYGLGDWGAFDRSTPLSVAATSAYFRYANAMTRIAEVLGETDDAGRYGKLANDILTAFNERVFNPTTGGYGSGSQASNALPLAAGLVPADRVEPVMTALKADITHRENHLSTGEVGLRALFDVLGETGEVDLVLTMARNPTPPSYAAMLASGATTLPEFWDGTGSQNHFMMGAINDWSYRFLAGIRPTAPAFRTFLVAPVVPRTLASVTATWETPYGTIESSWRKAEHRTLMTVRVPVNSEAEIRIPTDGTPSRILVNGEVVDNPVLTVGGGRYEIQSEPVRPEERP